jgi:hypothetical protein
MLEENRMFDRLQQKAIRNDKNVSVENGTLID